MGIEKEKPANSNAPRKTCLSCNRLKPAEEGVRFCSACMERSRMKNIDPLYDDIGGPG
jgi:hypothetical protein